MTIASFGVVVLAAVAGLAGPARLLAPVPASWQFQQLLWITTLEPSVSSAIPVGESWWQFEHATGDVAVAPVLWQIVQSIHRSSKYAS